MRAALAMAFLFAAANPPNASADNRVHVEVDPLPAIQGGYGGQLGIRPASLSGLRIALASFSLDVPDFAAQLGGNEGFHLRVRPSLATYLLYYPQKDREGWAFGGALRYLRMRYGHDDVQATRDTSELSPELIAGYKLHPGASGFYLQPWLGLSATLWRSATPEVGGIEYDPMPVQSFFTVNLGYELSL